MRLLKIFVLCLFCTFTIYPMQKQKSIKHSESSSLEQEEEIDVVNLFLMGPCILAKLLTDAFIEAILPGTSERKEEITKKTKKSYS